MSTYLVPTPFGVFVHNEDCRILYEVIVYPDEELATKMMMQIADKTLPVEIRDAIEAARQAGVNRIVVESSGLAALIRDLNVEVMVDNASRAIKMFRTSIDSVLIERGVLESEQQTTDFRRRVALGISREKIMRHLRSPDLTIKYAVETIDSLDKTINLLGMRLREWYAINVPAIVNHVEDIQTLVETVLSVGTGMPTAEHLVRAGLPPEAAKNIVEETAQEVGTPLSEEGLKPVLAIAQSIRTMLDARRTIEEYIEKSMSRVAPNMTALVGPLVGARLISAAGSLEDLAKKPSSTIQVLGAERALFRSLRTGAAPPKHGVIFQVPLVHSSPFWQRGKIARALAGKLAIAAKVDAHSGQDLSAALRLQLERRIEEIRRQNPRPSAKGQPEKQQQRPTRKRGSRGRRSRSR